MTLNALFEDNIRFGADLPEAVNRLLQDAVVAHRNDKPLAERLLKEALQTDRHCLPSYFALYKFYFYQGRLQEAEKAAIAGLQESAYQGQFPFDYSQLASGAWDMYASEYGLFYLYTLKALAFIKLRLEQTAEAQVILSLMQQLDPEDRSGGSVIRSLAEALNQEAS